MHTWTVTCDPDAAHSNGTTDTEVDAVRAAVAAMRRIVRRTHRVDEQPPHVWLAIDGRIRLGITADSYSPDAALDGIDRYEHDALIAAAVDDSICDRVHVEVN